MTMWCRHSRLLHHSTLPVTLKPLPKKLARFRWAQWHFQGKQDIATIEEKPVLGASIEYWVNTPSGRVKEIAHFVEVHQPPPKSHATAARNVRSTAR